MIERRKQWDATESATVRARFTAARNQLSLDLAELHDDEDDASQAAKARDVQDRLLEILGFNAGGWHVTTDGPIQRYASPQLEEGSALAIIRARPIETVDDVFARDPDEPTVESCDLGGQDYMSVARLISALFVTEDAPHWALILAGRWLVIAEKGRWAEGRCLGIDIQTVAERNDTKRAGEIDTALTSLEAVSLAPDADGAIWWDGGLTD